MKDSYRMVRSFVLTALLLLASLLSSSAVYAQTCVAPPSGLVGWWPGDGDATDIKGGHDEGQPHYKVLKNNVGYLGWFPCKPTQGPTPWSRYLL